MILKNDLPQEMIALLPYLARELLITGGIDAAIALINNFGGRRIIFSKKSRLYNEIIVLIGGDSFQAYDKYYGSESISIPSCHVFKRLLASKPLLDDIKGNESNANLAKKHGCSERWVYMLKKRMKEAD